MINRHFDLKKWRRQYMRQYTKRSACRARRNARDRRRRQTDPAYRACISLYQAQVRAAEILHRPIPAGCIINPQKVAGDRRKWFIRTPAEKLRRKREVQARWQREHPDRHREHSRNWWRRHRGAGSRPHPKQSPNNPLPNACSPRTWG